MGPWILAAVAILVGLFLLPAALDRLPRSKGGGGLGPMLGELNAHFNPSGRHVAAAQRQRPERPGDDEPKDDPEAG